MKSASLGLEIELLCTARAGGGRWRQMDSSNKGPASVTPVIASSRAFLSIPVSNISHKHAHNHAWQSNRSHLASCRRSIAHLASLGFAAAWLLDRLLQPPGAHAAHARCRRHH